MLQEEHFEILSTFIKLPLILSLRSLFSLFLSGLFTQVFLQRVDFKTEYELNQGTCDLLYSQACSRSNICASFVVISLVA